MPVADAARRVGERLQAEFRTLVRAFPLDARTIGGMSGWLGVTKPICQRLLRAIRYRGDALSALSFFPGVRGLRRFVQAAQERGLDPGLTAAAGAAVDRYEVLIDEHGGSQTRLLAALEQTVSGPPRPAAEAATTGDAMLDARRRVFEGVRQVTGREFETQVAVFLYRPCDDDPDRVDCVTAMGMIGIRRTPHAVPICPLNRFAFSTRDDPVETDVHVEGMLGEPVAAGAPVSVIAEFCSKPLPAVVAREVEAQLSVLIDPDSASKDPLDVVLGTRFPAVPHPARGEVKRQDCSLVGEGPSRHLLLSVHLHRGLARTSIPSLNCYALGNRGPIAAVESGERGTSPINMASQRWFDVLPDRPRLEHLGVGLDQAGSAAYPRITRLLSRLYAAQGWDPDDFVGYRCHVDYPLWGVQYLLSFDFSDEANGY